MRTQPSPAATHITTTLPEHANTPCSLLQHAAALTTAVVMQHKVATMAGSVRSSGPTPVGAWRTKSDFKVRTNIAMVLVPFATKVHLDKASTLTHC